MFSNRNDHVFWAALLTELSGLSAAANFIRSVVVHDWTREYLSISFGPTPSLTNEPADLTANSWRCLLWNNGNSYSLNENYEGMQRIVRLFLWNWIESHRSPERLFAFIQPSSERGSQGRFSTHTLENFVGLIRRLWSGVYSSRPPQIEYSGVVSFEFSVADDNAVDHFDGAAFVTDLQQHSRLASDFSHLPHTRFSRAVSWERSDCY
jgi:hypothetical protein